MTADHIPDLVLERYRLNELPPADAARMAGEIGRDPSLRERLAALDRSDHELDAQLDRLRTRLAASSVRGVRLQPDRSANRVRSIAWPLPAAVAIGVVLSAVIWQTRAPFVLPAPSEAGTDRIKGTAASGRPALAVSPHERRERAARRRHRRPCRRSHSCRVSSRGALLRRHRVDRRPRRRHDAPAAGGNPCRRVEERADRAAGSGLRAR